MLHKPAHLQRVGVAVCILSCKYVQVSVRHSVALFLLAPDLSCEVLQHWYCLCKFFFGKIAFLVRKYVTTKSTECVPYWHYCSVYSLATIAALISTL